MHEDVPDIRRGLLRCGEVVDGEFLIRTEGAEEGTLVGGEAAGSGVLNHHPFEV